MNFHLLRVYYKAAVIVPFYTACFFVLTGLLPNFFKQGFSIEALEQNEFARLLLMDVFRSGIIGLLTLTAFLNSFEEVASRTFTRVLAWMLAPYLYIFYILVNEIDWQVMQRPGTGQMMGATVMILLCFLHVIGIIISFIDFNATVKMSHKQNRHKREGKA